MFKSWAFKYTINKINTRNFSYFNNNIRLVVL